MKRLTVYSVLLAALAAMPAFAAPPAGAKVTPDGWFAPRKALLITRGFDRYTLINVSPSPKAVLVNGEPVVDRIVLGNGVKVETYGAAFVFRLADVGDA